MLTDVKDNQDHRRESIILYILFAVIFTLSLFPAIFSNTFSNLLLFGIPGTTAWLTLSFTIYLLLIVLGYRRVFRHWTRELSNDE